MLHRKPLWKELLSTAVMGAFAMAPVIGASVAQAAPPNKEHTKQQDKNQKQSHGKTPAHAPTSSHGKPPAHTTNPSHGQQPSHTQTPNHGQPQSHAPNPSHGSSQEHVWQRRSNDNQNESWHSSHGYTRSGSSWIWRGHDDAWWLKNGYGWNGTIWVLNNAGSNYGPFQTFTGTVTNVKNNREFDVRISGSDYDVYISTNAPRGLSRGDLVRVYGQRYGNNDIRNANVKILRNY